MYRVRVDIKSDLQPDAILKDKDAYIIVKHVLPHGNPHYHMYVHTTADIKINALRQRVKRYFDVSADEYSVKVCDHARIEEYWSYLFNTKNGNIPTLIKYNNIHPDVIEKAKLRALEITNEFNERQMTRRNNRKKTIYDMAEEIYSEAEQEIVASHNCIEGFVGTKNLSPQYYVPIYTRHAIRILQENRQPFDYFHLRKIVCTAMSMDTRNHAEIGRRVTQFFLD